MVAVKAGWPDAATVDRQAGHKWRAHDEPALMRFLQAYLLPLDAARRTRISDNGEVAVPR
jgi:hypothetical protein